jgi:hypothetical protein
MKTKTYTGKYPNPNYKHIFESGKGYFFIDDDSIMTKSQIVYVMDYYQLIEFLDGGDIQIREVVFWHANINGMNLNIVVYDNHNKVLIKKTHDLNRPRYDNDWFLLEEAEFENDMDLLEFDFDNT